MAGNVPQARKLAGKPFQEIRETIDLLRRIGFRHLLAAGVVPVRVASPVDQFDADTPFVEVFYVVRDTLDRNPLFNGTISFYVEVTGVSGSAFGVVDTFSVFPRGCEIGKLRAVNHDQVDPVR